MPTFASDNMFTILSEEDKSSGKRSCEESRLFLRRLLPDCDENDPEVDHFFIGWVAWFLCLAEINLVLRGLGHEETTVFSGLIVMKQVSSYDGTWGWCIKEKEDSDVYLYISNHDDYAEYIFPCTPQDDSEVRPLSALIPLQEGSCLPSSLSMWSKGVYRR
jgi:hypothetical protein